MVRGFCVHKHYVIWLKLGGWLEISSRSLLALRHRVDLVFFCGCGERELRRRINSLAIAPLDRFSVEMSPTTTSRPGLI